MSNVTRISLIGFGEVGQTLAADLLARDQCSVCAWDIQFSEGLSIPSRGLRDIKVRQATDPRDAVAQADLIISAVTAAEDMKAARSVASHIEPDSYFLDVNSVSPGMKKQVAQMIAAAGGRYVEAAIMSPISPRHIASPIFLGGPHAADFLPLARQLGFAGAEVFSAEIGRASAAKMCRSVIVKGMEALLAESLLTARHYGVEASVLDSLSGFMSTDNWPAMSRYMISRSLIHGRRRAEEMREVVRTVEEAGLNACMSAACAQRQDWAADYGSAVAQENLDGMLDAILSAALREKQ